jgi:hypothetical protein
MRATAFPFLMGILRPDGLSGINRSKCLRSEDYLFSKSRSLHHHAANNPSFEAFLTAAKGVPRWAKDGHGAARFVNHTRIRFSGDPCSITFPKLFAGCLAIVGHPSLR